MLRPPTQGETASINWQCDVGPETYEAAYLIEALELIGTMGSNAQ